MGLLSTTIAIRMYQILSNNDITHKNNLNHTTPQIAITLPSGLCYTDRTKEVLNTVLWAKIIFGKLNEKNLTHLKRLSRKDICFSKNKKITITSLGRISKNTTLRQEYMGILLETTLLYTTDETYTNHQIQAKKKKN